MSSGDFLSLLDDVVELYIEEARESECEPALNTFVTYIEDNLPPEVLCELRQLLGFDDEEEDKDEQDSWLTPLYELRFPSKEEEEDERGGFGPRECSICDRRCKLTRHHLIPRETHTNHRFRDLPVKELSKTIDVCGMCHRSIHRMFTNMELAESFNSLDQLMSDERMQRYAKWASSQGDRQNSKVK